MAKLIIRSDALPQHLQDELQGLHSALERKYGVAAHLVGTTIENLSNVCAMVRSENLTPDERTAAHQRSREVCADVIHVLARLLNVQQPAAMAVAEAYRDLSARIEEEMLGADVLKDTQSEAAAVIAKASMH